MSMVGVIYYKTVYVVMTKPISVRKCCGTNDGRDQKLVEGTDMR